ncbi:DNA-directed RNA polymerase subunit beta' [Trifolium repens]|nr:DNA-directed RNA polymerase subunit beta' [Trifolium repens]
MIGMPFFATQGFDTFRNREISSGAGAIREQLVDLDLRIIMDSFLVEWKELGEVESTDNENEWEDRKALIVANLGSSGIQLFPYGLMFTSASRDGILW